MATYGTGLKLVQSIATNRSTNGTVYTVPAGRYAIVNWFLLANAPAVSVVMTVNAFGYANLRSIATGDFLGTSGALINTVTVVGGGGQLYLGPGDVVAVTFTGGTGGIALTGAEFSN